MNDRLKHRLKHRLIMAPGGPEISRIVYGVWRMFNDSEGAHPERLMAKIQACLDAGITTFDHADIYGGYACERAFGDVLRANPGLRQRVEIITKCGIMLVHDARPDTRIKHYQYSRRHIIQSVERSLDNLGTDRIDVLLLHRPSPLLDPDEVAEALVQLRAQGKVLHAGVSNFTPRQLDMVQSRLDRPLVANQIELHPLRPEPFIDGTLDHCIERRVAPMAWSPLAGGRLLDGHGEAEQRVRHVLGPMCERYQAGMDQLLYAWLLSHPARIIPVLGSNRPERIQAAAGALDIDLDIQDWFAIWTAATGRDVP